MTARNAYLAAFLLICALAAYGASPAANAKKLTAADANSTVTLKVGNLLEVSLEGNPTTGYTWELAPGGGVLLSRQGASEFKPNTKAMGSGGVVTLRFKAVQEGRMKLKLVYHRTFEPNVPPVKSFDVDLVVEK